MSRDYPTFALKLPSGGWVEVRHPTAAAVLGAGHLLSPLLAASAEAAGIGEEDDVPAKREPIAVVRRYCEAVLVHPKMPGDIDFDEVAFSDAYAIYAWATTRHGETRALRSVDWVVQDFLPLVKSLPALHLDACCHRYGQRPSVVLGVEDTDFAWDLDIAIAYRGMRHESDATRGEVEVDDMYGGKHKVPREWLASSHVESGAAVMGEKQLARMAAHQGGQFMALSAGGGADTGTGDGKIGPMPLPGSDVNRGAY